MNPQTRIVFGATCILLAPLVPIYNSLSKNTSPSSGEWYGSDAMSGVGSQLADNRLDFTITGLGVARLLLSLTQPDPISE